ncbi:isocitrate lyase/phosphoenolpyruvate mutase family protein [Frankia sp. KB5]|uniref:isocitrate lyase/phosphoenolpyruvate mutase family protein n=1 Tax=Frankia sp. KB5 TaxID=683318 RepID=UPI000A103C03|nr:isocitrate lyase/phosphoenolpyruvate mutase family protein [Frankia sp. KB5]ORT47269.1 phosphoenolpyruvate phosphomutase [Frankia sp. KB5]
MPIANAAAGFRQSLTVPSSLRPMLAAGAVNAMAARLAAEEGFDALWVSGLEVSAALGLPDANVLGVRDLGDVVTALGRVTEHPVIVDVDNAGGALDTAARFAADMARAGAAAICLEDSSYPKCNSFAVHAAQGLADTELVARQIERIRKTVGNDLVVIARTESLITGSGMEAALARSARFVEAGAEAILIHSKDPTGHEALRAARQWGKAVPLVTVPTAFPQLTADELGQAGFRLCIYANQFSRAALAGMRAAARQFTREGTFRTGPDAPLAEVGELLRVGEPDALSCI